MNSNIWNGTDKPFRRDLINQSYLMTHQRKPCSKDLETSNNIIGAAQVQRASNFEFEIKNGLKQPNLLQKFLHANLGTCETFCKRLGCKFLFTETT